MRNWSFYSDIEYSRLVRLLQEEFGYSRDDVDRVVGILREMYLVKIEGDLLKIFRESRELLDEIYRELDSKCST
jgi:hypothetical protein